MVTLISNDNVTFTVPKEVASQSSMLRTALEDVGDAEEPVPIPAVDGWSLGKTLEYAAGPFASGEQENWDDAKKTSWNAEKKTWEADYISRLTGDDMLKVVTASNFLDIAPLTKLLCKSIADFIKDKTIEEIREYLDIPDNDTPEQKKQIEQELKWLEDENE